MERCALCVASSSPFIICEYWLIVRTKIAKNPKCDVISFIIVWSSRSHLPSITVPSLTSHNNNDDINVPIYHQVAHYLFPNSRFTFFIAFPTGATILRQCLLFVLRLDKGKVWEWVSCCNKFSWMLHDVLYNCMAALWAKYIMWGRRFLPSLAYTNASCCECRRM